MNTQTRNQVVLTIDFEDWFHSLDPSPENWTNYERRIEYGTDKLLEFLSLKNSRATFFVLGDAAQHNRQLIKKINEEGHEVASHGWDHKFIYKQSKEEFRNDVAKSVKYLSDLTGKKIISYRAPYFSITKKSVWAFEILAEEGIEIDSSIFPVINHRYGIPGNRRLPYKISNELWEWPVTTYKIFGGNLPFSEGVYFRFLPLKISEYFLSSLLNNNEPVLFYIHPWELDYNQPQIKNIPVFLKFRHYYGLENTYTKLFKLLSHLNSTSLCQGIKEIK